jgi:DNA-binding beta-propeller fold protein YncE
MNKLCSIFLISLLALSGAVAQDNPSNDESAPLVLVRIIPMPDVQGRFDHMGIDVKTGRIYAANYGDDSVEVLETQRGKRVHRIQGGLSKPQMVLYLPDSNRIVVSNEGDGSCKILDADTYSVLDTVKFSEDADQLRYDPVKKWVYVAYGDAIGVFDATTDKRIEGDYELGAHPESFQLEEKGPRIFVNLASLNQIAVLNRETHKIEKWKLTDAGTNFPMALDEERHRLFVAARRPARLLVLNTDSGKVVASLPGAADSDDMAYDPTRKRIYIPSAEGFIFVYQQIDADRYERIAKIPSAIGARTAAYYGQVGKHNSLYLAVPGRSNRGAELWIYETRD